MGIAGWSHLMEVMWRPRLLGQLSARQLRELDEDALPSSFLLKIERVKGGDRVSAPTRLRPPGAEAKPTRLPRRRRQPGSDSTFTTVNPPCSRT